jgi:hypothetical protein
MRAFDEFVEDCTTLGCLSVINVLENEDGAQKDTFGTGIIMPPEKSQRLLHALQPYVRDARTKMRLKSHLYNHHSARLQTPSVARTAVSAPLALPVPSTAQTGLFLKRLVEEPAFPMQVLQDKFGLARPTTSGPRAARHASVRLRLHKITYHLPR